MWMVRYGNFIALNTHLNSIEIPRTTPAEHSTYGDGDFYGCGKAIITVTDRKNGIHLFAFPEVVLPRLRSEKKSVARTFDSDSPRSGLATAAAISMLTLPGININTHIPRTGFANDALVIITGDCHRYAISSPGITSSGVTLPGSPLPASSLPHLCRAAFTRRHTYSPANQQRRRLWIIEMDTPRLTTYKLSCYAAWCGRQNGTGYCEIRCIQTQTNATAPVPPDR